LKLFIFRATQFLKYWINSNNAHGLHSPFVFSFYNNAIKQSFYLSETLKLLKSQLKADNTAITFTHPQTKAIFKTRIKTIAKSSLSSLKFNKFLCKLINWQNYKSVLETGTSLGYNGLVISESTQAQFYSIEGAKEIHQFANLLWSKHSNKKSNLIQGEIDKVFKEALCNYKPDLVFLDADHRSSVLLRQIEQMKSLHMPSCIVIHDIYWSKDMLNFWNELIIDETFKLTIDIYQAGIIFTNYAGVKQHFQVRF